MHQEDIRSIKPYTPTRYEGVLTPKGRAKISIAEGWRSRNALINAVLRRIEKENAPSVECYEGNLTPSEQMIAMITYRRFYTERAQMRKWRFLRRLASERGSGNHLSSTDWGDEAD